MDMFIDLCCLVQSSRPLTNSSVEVGRPATNTEWPAGTFRDRELVPLDMLKCEPSDLTHLFASRKVPDQFMFVVSAKNETAVLHLPRNGSSPFKVLFDKASRLFYIVFYEVVYHSVHADSQVQKNEHTQNAFLTDVAPLPEQPACVAITHKTALHRQHFLKELSPVNFTGKILNFKIRKLIPGWSDDELFALGTKSVEVGMRLVSITTPGPKNKVVVTEIAKIPDLSLQDEFAVKMPDPGSTVNDDKFIIIASIGPDRLHRRTVYRANIVSKT